MAGRELHDRPEPMDLLRRRHRAGRSHHCDSRRAASLHGPESLKVATRVRQTSVTSALGPVQEFVPEPQNTTGQPGALVPVWLMRKISYWFWMPNCGDGTIYAPLVVTPGGPICSGPLQGFPPSTENSCNEPFLSVTKTLV